MRFYNPGTAINDKLAFTVTDKDPREGNTTGYHSLVAGEKDFFEVPDIKVIETLDGEARIPTPFSKNVKRSYAQRGVVMVDANCKNPEEDDNVAPTEAKAREKGDVMWKGYLRSLVQEHYNNVQEVKAAGGVPRTAFGIYKYALTTLGFEDPADHLDGLTRAKEGQVQNKDMQSQLAAMQAQIAALTAGK